MMETTWGTRLCFLAGAGALGTVARYGLTYFVQLRMPQSLAVSSWSVNILGCFLFGLCWVLARSIPILGQDLRLILLVGFMGSFTTFSSYIFECVELAERGAYWTLVGNIFLQNCMGFAALGVGIWLGSFFE